MPEANWWDSEPKWAPSGEAPPTGNSGAVPTAAIDTVEHGGRPTITVRPKNWWDTEPKWAPVQSASDVAGPISTGEAAGRGAIDAATFGTAPAIAGLSAAGATAPEPLPMVGEFPGLEIPAYGAAKLSRGDEAARQAAEQERADMAAKRAASFEQHPIATTGGELAGGLVTPGFGAMSAGTLPARIGSGMIAGGIGGGLYGAGSAVGEGGGPQEALSGAAKGVAFGAPTGGLLHGAVGPRAVTTGPTPASRAAETARELGKPIPKGLASESPGVNVATAAMQSFPLLGSRISNAVEHTQRAAGERVGDIAGQLGGGERAVSDVLVRPGLKQVIEANRATADASYKGVRDLIDQDARFTMPRTDATLNAIMRARAEAGWENPAQGLEQFRNVAGGATFNGAHRARVDARDAGNVLVPHPGYNKGDYNRLTRAMTVDLRDMVQAAGGKNGKKAVQAFDEAEKQFGRLADQNDKLNRLVNSQGEGTIAKLLSAAKEKGGNLQLLAQLKQTMTPEEFDQIGGQLLSELGHNSMTGEFSLGKFATEWDKVSDGAKRVLFSPQHQQNIDDIFNLGSHLKGALKKSNTSHTAAPLVILDLIRDAILGAVAIGGSGVIGAGTVAGAVAGAPFIVFAHWASSPAKAASMAAWARAYRGVKSGAGAAIPPARISAFKLATRNLSHNLNIPEDKIFEAVGKGQEQAPAQQQPAQAQENR